MSDPQPRSTHFAPAERASAEELRQLAAPLVENPVARAILESVAGYVMVLDEHRQIVAANAEMLLALESPAPETLWGMRPGEAVHCVHATDGPGGCGTGPECQHCGAVLSILNCQREQKPDIQECLLRMVQQGRETAGEFRVRSSPITLEGRALTVFVLQDISAAKRKEALESVFFHDVLNLVGGLQGASRLLSLTPENAEDVALQIIDISSLLTQEILSQRLLLNAEQGHLAPVARPVVVADILSELGKVFRNHEVARDRGIDVHYPEGAQITTDPVLLGRVLINMLKNALEATPRGGKVSLEFRWEGPRPVFQVHNEGVIPPDVCGRIFQRSFSTKAAKGRGLGTYSMKVFGEQVLHGEVGFLTDPIEGTRFFLRLPGLGQDPDLPAAAQVSSPFVTQASQERVEPTPGSERLLGAEKPTVLVVDDSPTIMAVLASLLSKEAQILEAQGGEEGLRLARTHQPDLILLDVVMPGMDGFEVCRHLKADSRTRDIPVIFLSAMTQEADEAMGLSVGAIDYVTKPVSPAIVRARVRNHLELKRYRDTLKDLSMRDGLTGIANRRRFDEYFEQEWSRAQRQEWPLTVMIGDVDHFKLFNDGYGHLQGDVCLRRVAEVLQNELKRATDLVARYGGEEFAILLPDVDERGAWGIARRLMEGIRRANLPHRFSPVAPYVTLSLGLATVRPGCGDAREGLLGEADRQLYMAKAAGRDRFSPPAPPA